MAELIARRYMMMIIFEKFFSWWYFKGRGMLDVFEGLLNWWYDCWWDDLLDDAEVACGLEAWIETLGCERRNCALILRLWGERSCHRHDQLFWMGNYCCFNSMWGWMCTEWMLNLPKINRAQLKRHEFAFHYDFLYSICTYVYQFHVLDFSCSRRQSWNSKDPDTALLDCWFTTVRTTFLLPPYLPAVDLCCELLRAR